MSTRHTGRDRTIDLCGGVADRGAGAAGGHAGYWFPAEHLAR
jgi:hypothetical protein